MLFHARLLTYPVSFLDPWSGKNRLDRNDFPVEPLCPYTNLWLCGISITNSLSVIMKFGSAFGTTIISHDLGTFVMLAWFDFSNRSWRNTFSWWKWSPFGVINISWLLGLGYNEHFELPQRKIVDQNDPIWGLLFYEMKFTLSNQITIPNPHERKWEFLKFRWMKKSYLNEASMTELHCWFERNTFLGLGLFSSVLVFLGFPASTASLFLCMIIRPTITIPRECRSKFETLIQYME